MMSCIIQAPQLDEEAIQNSLRQMVTNLFDALRFSDRLRDTEANSWYVGPHSCLPIVLCARIVGYDGMDVAFVNYVVK